MTLDTSAYDYVLQGLLEQYSPSHNERPASEYLAGQMELLGYEHAFVDEANNAVGIIGNGPREIVLLGHIDTVPGFIRVEKVEGRLYGRGAVDAKGPLSTFTCAAAAAGRQPGWKIIVIGAVEEEAASSKGARHALTRYNPEMCVIGEPSQWDRITLGYKGRLLADYRMTRPLTHTARPEQNAYEHAVEYWNVVRAHVATLNQEREKAFDQIFATIRAFNSHDDGFCETATMSLGFRLPLDLAPEEFMEILRSHAGLAEITFRGAEVAYRAEKNTPLVRAFNNAIRDVGSKPGYVYKTGTSDMNIVGPVWKCPIVAYGPGDSSLDHTPEEHILLDEYHKGIEVVSHVLRNLNGI